MDSKVQRRIQRYGWDLAATDYERLWQAQFAEVQTMLLAQARIAPGDAVLDLACGTGLVTMRAAGAVGPEGSVLGVDLSGKMIEVATGRAEELGLGNVRFERMDGEALALPDASFDVALCALGLMYMPAPELALRELSRVLRPGGRMALAVWGERSQCGWHTLFPIVDAEVASEVCPLFFRLGQPNILASMCEDAALQAIQQKRLATRLTFAHAEAVCHAFFAGGPVALAWSRFNDAVRTRVQERYLASIHAWRRQQGFEIPAEFLVLWANKPLSP
jgi:ubiquinone/menaquinone biosynthesis C-methylase UbiE